MNIQSQNKISEIPGLYSGDQAKPWSNDGLTEDQPAGDGTDGFDPQDKTSMILLRGKSLLTDLTLEKDSLDKNFVHAHRLLDAEIARVQCGGELKDTGNSNIKQFDKVYISTRDQKKFNLLGRLLGPKGMTVKRIQAETQTKMSILGRGSMRDKKKEEELRSTADPTYQHLKDELHVLIEANPPYSVVKLAAGVAEVKKMLIPLEPGMEDIVAAKFLDPMMQQQGPGGPGPGGSGSGGFSGSPGFPGKALLPSPREERAMRGGGRGGSISGGGRGRGGGGGGGFMGGRGRGRGGTPRGGGGRGGRGRGMGGGDRGGANGRLMRGGGAGGGSWDSGGGGGPMRTRSAGGGGGYDSYDRRSEYSEHRGSSGYDDYQPHVGYGSERIGGGGGGGGGGEGSYRRPDTLSNTVSDNDPYYSSFSDPPSSSTRNFSVSRDYNHGSSAGDAGSTPSWKSSQSSRRDHRYHPYQQSGSFSDY